MGIALLRRPLGFGRDGAADPVQRVAGTEGLGDNEDLLEIFMDVWTDRLLGPCHCALATS